MSRLGKKPIKVPDQVEVKIEKKKVLIKSPKGEEIFKLPPKIEAKIDDDKIMLESPIRRKEERMIYGMTRSQLANIIKGAGKDFKKKLEFNGVGYNAALEGNKLKLNVGFSNPVFIEKDDDIDVKVEKNIITVSGANKEKVGMFASKVRAAKRVEPYKGKGIKYKNEHVRRKVGKTALKSEGEGGE